MTEIPSEALDAYLDAHATPLEPLLQENREATYASLSSPQMIAGPVLGRLLRFLVSLAAPRLVLEIGTFTRLLGARHGRRPAARGADRHLRALARARRRSPRATSTARRGAIASTCASGRRSTTVNALDGPFDFVFIDADKDGYPDYYEAVVPKLSPRGMIAVDNTLSGGDVADPADERDRANGGLQRPRAGRRAHRERAAQRARRRDPDPPRGRARPRRSRLALSVRRPLREAPGHPRRCSRPRHADRGRHRQGHARDPPRAARGRRQLQGRQVVHGDGQGALPGRRRARARSTPASRWSRSSTRSSPR